MRALRSYLEPLQRSAVGLAVVGGTILWFGWPLISGSGRTDLQDFVEYWGAGRLNAAGENPYDARPLYAEERRASPGLTEAIMMWNPPWTLSLVMPFGGMSPGAAHLLWLGCQSGVLLWCADRTWSLYGGPARLRWLGWLLGVGSVPAYFVLYMGQISALILLGLVAFLVFERRGWCVAAGAALIVAGLKPHLLVAFGVCLGCWTVYGRHWRMAAGVVLGAIVLSAAPVVCNRAVFAQYAEAVGHQPPQMLSPTFGSLLRLAFGVDHFRLQFVPTVVGAGWAACHWWRRRDGWSWKAQTPLLLLVSFLAAPYGAWPFDTVVLLIPILRRAVDLVRQPERSAIGFGLCGWAAFNLLALALRNVHYTQFYLYAWMTPLLLYAYVVVAPRSMTPTCSARAAQA